MMMLESVKTAVNITFSLYSLKMIYFVVINDIMLVAKEFALNKTIIHLVFKGATKKKFPIAKSKGSDTINARQVNAIIEDKYLKKLSV